MSANEFTISVTDLDAGGKEYRFPVRSGWVRGAFEGHEATATESDGMLAVRASKSGHDIVVHGTLDASLQVPCARCLTPFTLPIHSDLSVLYVRGARSPRASADRKEAENVGELELTLEDGEADTLPFDGEKVVLDDLVRDELVLEIPMIPLCSEACPGMSPGPREEGAGSSEKDIDPRLAPLLAFKAKPTK
ncbi:MAG: DUF177 domain-containing protein [Deltaproteobacteria bacterium]|nr:DUF177 domain-containing protein [Deltaproteobacteria bacterium]